MFAGDRVDGGLGQIPALVAQAALHRAPALAGIDQLDLALAVGLFAVGHHPHEGADAGVVKHLLRQGNDCFQLVAFNDPAPDLALAAAGATGEQGGTVEHNGNPGARPVAIVRPEILHLAHHVEQKQQRSIIDTRQLAGISAEVGPAVDRLLLRFPVHSKGGVGQQVVEPLLGKGIAGECVAELYAAILVAFDQQVGRRYRIGAGVVVLPKHLDRRLIVVGADPVLRFRQHPAGAAGGVADGHDHTRLRQHLCVGLQ